MAIQREQMASVDHTWLRMEAANNFMMIGTVLIFKDPLEYDRLKQVLEQRLVKPYARFRQRVEKHQTNAYWIEMEQFDIEDHIVCESLDAPQQKQCLQQLADRLLSTPLDFAKPLWQIHFIPDYQHGSALIIRIHHSIADGMSLVRLLISLTDSPDNAALCSNTATAGAGSRDIHQHDGKPLKPSQQLFSLMQKGIAGLAELLKVTFRPSDPRTGLKGTLSGHKRVSWIDPFPLADVKHIGHRLEATVNDVLMATAAGAIRTYLNRNGTTLNKTIHVAVPFNLRPIDAPMEKLGNEFGLVLVALPIHIDDPMERLRQVKRNMNRLKHSIQPHVFYGLINLLGKGPSIMEKTALNILSRKASFIMTNVPGPKQPLFLAGAELYQPLAWVPQSGDIGVGMAILSYNDNVHFGFIADSNLIPDPDEVANLFAAEFRTMEMLVNQTLNNQPHAV